MPAVARDLARGHYLRALSTRDPRILAELRVIAPDDTKALTAWHRRWPWALRGVWAIAWAQETIRLSGGRYWCPPNEDTEGSLVRPTRDVTPTWLARAAPLLEPDPDRFAELAAYQLGTPWLRIAREAGRPVQNVRRDCTRLSRLIELPLRRTRPGRPAHS